MEEACNQCTSDCNCCSPRNVDTRKHFFFPITVEPILFLLFYATSCTDSVITSLLEERSCIQYLNISDDVCGKRLTPEIEELVQPHTTKIIMSKCFIEAFIPAILSFFIGPWSDVNGRKPFLVSSLAGYILCFIIWGCLSLIYNTTPYIFLLTTVPVALSGGLVAIFTCSFCYISDVTTESNRAYRMAVVEGFLVMGILLGYLTSSKIFNAVDHMYGPLAVFSIAGGACLIALIYTLFFLTESVNTDQTNRTQLLDVTHLKSMFIILYNKRPQYGRAKILIMCVVCGISIVIVQGEPSVRFLSLREVFSWNSEHYNYFSAACSCISVVASMLGIWILSVVLKIPSTFIALITALMGMAAGVLMSISKTSVDFFISANLGCFGPLVGPLLRSELAKIVPGRDLGKVFAFVSSLEATLPLSGPPMYTQLYSYFLLSMPLAVYFLSSALSLLNALLVITVIVMEMSAQTLLQVNTESEEEPILTGDEP